MTKILKAKPLIREIYQALKQEIEEKKSTPNMTVVMIGEDPASLYYVQSVEKRAKKIGAKVSVIRKQKMTEEELFTLVEKLNDDTEVHGIMLQKPLPKEINEDRIVSAINPDKDVDGFHPLNAGKLVLGKAGFIPCTPAAVIEMMKFYEIESSGKKVVVIGRSDIVGKPMANLLLRKSQQGNATVTICHSRTKNLAAEVRQADIIIAAIGKPLFITDDMVKEGAIVLDVGVNEIEIDGEKKYVGDVNYDKCFSKASMITPVPGGIGSVTTAMLMKNLLHAYNINS